MQWETRATECSTVTSFCSNEGMEDGGQDRGAPSHFGRVERRERRHGGKEGVTVS